VHQPGRRQGSSPFTRGKLTPGDGAKLLVLGRHEPVERGTTDIVVRDAVGHGVIAHRTSCVQPPQQASA
jgi:hypothetical protein